MLQIFTIGHSTRTVGELTQLLTANKVNVLADVRSFPRSYKNPQFNIEVIEAELAKYDIRYLWLQKLGGRRKGLGRQSKNKCWKSVSFRNYADYMETPSFLYGAKELVELANKETVAIMCAEALYWRCHRFMISDFLKSRGMEVIHILSQGFTRDHEYTPCAKIRGGKLAYR